MALRRTKRKERRAEREAQQQAQIQSQNPAPDNRMQFSDIQKQQLMQQANVDFRQSASAPAENGSETQSAQQNRFIGTDMTTAQQMSQDIAWQQHVESVAQHPPITSLEVQKAAERLKKYKTQKQSLEKRLIANEQYWKLRQWDYIDDAVSKNRLKVNTAWLWNCISAKHADLMDGYPESNIRPKRADDKAEAKKLTSIIPVVFDENNYHDTYSNICNYILKQGTACVGVFWDGSKHDGLGDISIRKIDLLELFWEAGVENIQDSKEVFLTKYEDKDKLKKAYPDLETKLGGKDITVSEYKYDDKIDTSNKALVVDWYYKLTDDNGNQVLHYCKFCNGNVLFATENEPQKYPNGWYDHGKYPFIVKPLFPVEGTIAGYGYQDIGRGDQNAIDVLTSAILTNAVASSKPRYFTKMNSGINEAEFANLSNDFVHVQGSFDDINIREITQSALPNYIIEMRDRFIDEMKESLGNRDVSNGGTTSGITAASAIAAMQEQGGKMSRDHNRTMYQMHKEITEMAIELIRQFYTVPREYRITGKMGEDEFVQYSNAGLQPQPQPSVLGIEMGLRLPCFDIEVNAQKANPYTKMEQNELALQLYNAQVFNPQNTDQALALLETMDFSHKDEVMQRVSKNGTMLQKYQQLQQIAFRLAQLVDPAMAEQLAQAILAENGQNPLGMTGEVNPEALNQVSGESEHPYVTKARANSQKSTQVE